jgi:hypothetical protein
MEAPQVHENHCVLHQISPNWQVRLWDWYKLYRDLGIQWYLGIIPLWNKSNLVYVLFGREKFCLVYDFCLEYDSHARTCMSKNESWHRALLSSTPSK